MPMCIAGDGGDEAGLDIDAADAVVVVSEDNVAPRIDDDPLEEDRRLDCGNAVAREVPVRHHLPGGIDAARVRSTMSGGNARDELLPSRVRQLRSIHAPLRRPGTRRQRLRHRNLLAGEVRRVWRRRFLRGDGEVHAMDALVSAWGEVATPLRQLMVMVSVERLLADIRGK